MFCTCKGQVLSKKDNTVIVCGQNSKVAIRFSLSEEWLNMTCYARFKPERGSAIDVSLSSEYAVEVPHEVTDNSGTFKVSLRAQAYRATHGEEYWQGTEVIRGLNFMA